MDACKNKVREEGSGMSRSLNRMVKIHKTSPSMLRITKGNFMRL